jgi:hypothetical protein
VDLIVSQWLLTCGSSAAPLFSIMTSPVLKSPNSLRNWLKCAGRLSKTCCLHFTMHFGLSHGIQAANGTRNLHQDEKGREHGHIRRPVRPLRIFISSTYLTYTDPFDDPLSMAKCISSRCPMASPGVRLPPICWKGITEALSPSLDKLTAFRSPALLSCASARSASWRRRYASHAPGAEPSCVQGDVHRCVRPMHADPSCICVRTCALCLHRGNTCSLGAPGGCPHAGWAAYTAEHVPGAAPVAEARPPATMHELRHGMHEALAARLCDRLCSVWDGDLTPRCTLDLCSPLFRAQISSWGEIRTERVFAQMAFLTMLLVFFRLIT